MDIITFTKSSLPYGWLGNMSAYPLSYQMQLWGSSEALFQSMRYEDKEIKEAIRTTTNGFLAKQVAKQHIKELSITPGSEQDMNNMRFCIELKIKQYPELEKALLSTGDSLIIEDCTSRGKNTSNLYWGAVLENDVWVGENWMGKLWMELRDNKIKKDK